MSQSTNRASPLAAMRMLVILDESAAGQKVAALAVALARRMSADAVFLLPFPIEHIEEKSPAEMAAALEAHRAAREQRAAPWFAAALRIADAAGVNARTQMSVDENPVAASLRVAAEQDCELIVVGSRGRGPLSQLLHASLASELVQQSPRPVVVCREDMVLGETQAAGPDEAERRG